MSKELSFQEEVTKYFVGLGIDKDAISVGQEGDFLYATTSLQLINYGVDVELNFAFNKPNNSVIFNVIFPKVSINPKLFEKLNEFNFNSAWLRSFVNEENRLILLFSQLNVDNVSIAIGVLDFLIKNVLSEEMKTILTPLLS
jgi:hypothetical protein